MLGLLVAMPLVAQNSVQEQLQVPSCLAGKLSSDYVVLAENHDFKIIDVPARDLRLISRIADQTHCGRFINLSARLAAKPQALRRQAAIELLPQSSLKPSVHMVAGKYDIAHQKRVLEAFEQIDADNIWRTVSVMSSYINRSSTQKHGVTIAEWLKDEFERMAVEYGRKDTETYFVQTGGRYIQPSLVTVLGKDIKAPAVVLGAHMDTLGDDENERMPGAGDDGSGSASTMEVARVLLASQNTLKRPVYIIWYAAEEQGLVGSQQVVQHFLNQKIAVYAAMQFDMTGYRHDEKDKTMWVFRDYTDNELSDYIAALISNYIKVPVAYSKCGYGCSDHASWNEQGIPAAFPCETSFEDHNPYIHSSADSMSLLNLEHMTNFTKLGLAYVIEMAGVEKEKE